MSNKKTTARTVKFYVPGKECSPTGSIMTWVTNSVKNNGSATKIICENGCIYVIGFDLERPEYFENFNGTVANNDYVTAWADDLCDYMRNELYAHNVKGLDPSFDVRH